MNAAPDRGDALLLAHCASLDPASPTARERLDDVLGPELAHKLVWALSTAPTPHPGVWRLEARAVFAA